MYLTIIVKDSNDFLKLFFRDINHRVIRGLMYKFDDNYWIVNNYNDHSGVSQQCGIRRCNNALKIVDPMNGSIFSIPCCVDYDMTSPSVQKSRYIITPNNHATIIVQGNDDTLRLFKTNTRYILSGRPFKLLAYQNAVEYSERHQQSTLLYLDLYLDELHDGDDLENGVAVNGQYDYSVSINADDMVLTNGASGQLQADVMLNGKEVNRSIVWKSSNDRAVRVDNDGNYTVIGQIGGMAVITASIVGNPNVKSEINIVVASEQDVTPNIVIDPAFDTIRQYETIDFAVKVEYDGQTYTDFEDIRVWLDGANGCAELRDNADGTYSMTAVNISNTQFFIQVLVRDFNVGWGFPIQVVSMFG